MAQRRRAAHRTALEPPRQDNPEGVQPRGDRPGQERNKTVEDGAGIDVPA